jgi:50S ribosomal protein L16 3-hydroxylase
MPALESGLPKQIVLKSSLKQQLSFSMQPQISLGTLTPAQFLAEYWQKKPLLIRQALPQFTSPLSPDELAGLACEMQVESRLIMERGGKHPWQVRHGPFTAADFAQLPETHWTLLVQEVDRHVPEIADLIDKFNFIPSWRIDDLMISYAVPQGSVGPHTDSYDVFLLQAYGSRRWQISSQVSELLPDFELKILREFTPEQEWIVSPGDLLYLPPNVAHYGVALTDCMTFSIGFLAPSHTDMLHDYVSFALSQLDENTRYTDPDLQSQAAFGEISAATLQKIKTMIDNLPTDSALIQQWFGRFVTQARSGARLEPLEIAYTAKTWFAELQHATLRRAARMAFISHTDTATLFIEGQAITLPKSSRAIATLLTQQRDFTYQDLQKFLKDDFIVKLLIEMTNDGFLYFYED